MSFRSWMSIITFALIILVVYLSRHELARAWELMSSVNLSILSLAVVAILCGHIANGEMIFSYLRRKHLIKQVSPIILLRMSMEMNFVNHVLPSGGVSGISYMTWRLSGFGVSSGKATMAQAVRFVAGFAAFITLLAIAVIVVTIDGNINRWIILISSTLVAAMVGVTMLGMYLVRSPARINTFSNWLSRVVNRFVSKMTRGKKRVVLRKQTLHQFFDDIHEDYMDIIKDHKSLKVPYLWALVFTVMEVLVFLITFWALGSPINPAPILIAYGVASMAGFIVITPGGAGAYEALMVSILAIAGINQGTAIAGIVLARVIILLVTIGVGYLFYQHALLKYGKKQSPDF